MSEVQAAETASHLVYADLCGVHSHGAVRVEYYSERIHKGGITLEPEIRFEKTGESSGVPSAADTPLIFDMATTVQAWGKILDARSKGREIPADWAVDENGKATTDPHEVRGLMPIAGPKGYGLMMMVDIFSGVLMNLPFGKHFSSMYNDLHAGRNLGQLYIILDPARFGDADTFRQHISQTMEELNAIKPAAGFSSVRYPAQGSNERYERNKSQGVEIPESIIDYLKSDVIQNNSYEGLSAFAN